MFRLSVLNLGSYKLTKFGRPHLRSFIQFILCAIEMGHFVAKMT